MEEELEEVEEEISQSASVVSSHLSHTNACHRAVVSSLLAYSYTVCAWRKPLTPDPIL